MAPFSSSSKHRTRSTASFSFLRLVAAAVLLVILPSLWLIQGNLTGTSTGAQEFSGSVMIHEKAEGAYHNHRQAAPPSLSELTNTYNLNDKQACEAKSFVYIPNKMAPEKDTSSYKIPKIIHQTSKSRCMTQMFAKVSKKWRNLPGYDYYFHNDESMMRLLTSYKEEFPLLHDLVKANCLRHGTIKADVWRYLVLWEYGGLYADIDSQPTSLFNTTTPILQASDDGWFVVEQFHVLSQYVMAVSPRHPLMYYAIHHATQKLVLQTDTAKINAALVTGPHALHRAYQDFRKDAHVNVDPQGPGYKPVWAGVFEGTDHRSITVVGKGEHEGEFITREMLSLPLKKKQYAKMNMTSFHDDKMEQSGQSCFSALYQYHARTTARAVPP